MYTVSVPLAIFRVGVETETSSLIPGLSQVAVGGDTARILEHSGGVEKIPSHERCIAIGEVVFRAARSGIEVTQTRSDFTDPASVSSRWDAVADVLEAVEDGHRRVFDTVLIAGDERTCRLAVIDVLTLLVEEPAHGVESLDELSGDGGVIAEPQRSADDEDVSGFHEWPHFDGPGVVLPTVFPHVRVHAGSNVVVDESDGVHRHSLGPHQRDALVHQPLRVAEIGALLQRAVDENCS